MIEPMKKTVIVCMKKDQRHCLQELSNLGILHIANCDAPPSSDYEKEFALLEQVQSVEKTLTNSLQENKNHEAVPDHKYSWREIHEYTHELENHKTSCIEALNRLKQDIAKISPWGNFDMKDVEKLKANGLTIKFYVASIHDLPVLPEGVIAKEINRVDDLAYFMAFMKEEVSFDIEEFVFPEETDVSMFEDKIKKVERKLKIVNEHLYEIALHGHEVVKQKLHKVEERLNFLSAQDKMGDQNDLCYIQGFIPEKDIEIIEKEVEKHSWGILIETPSNEEQVPTLITVPKWFRSSKVLFSFLGITPDYNEIDVSVPMILFLLVFFAILVGDAAYGIILLIACLAIRLKAQKEAITQASGLMGIMAVATIIWGALNGTWFAMDTSNMPRFMQGLDWLTNESTKDAHQQLVMFSLGIVHLLLGHFLYIIHHGYKDLRSLIGNIGWVCFLFGNYVIIASMLVFQSDIPSWIGYLYLPGLIGIFINIQWTNVGAIFNLPFSLINSMVDLASYIRLFAVGMAGFYIASSVNTVAQLIGEFGIVGYIVMIILLILGHTLNIGLCLMSVMVHGIRLNTLEFSNHVSVSWSGIFYSPFKKIEAKK